MAPTPRAYVQQTHHLDRRPAHIAERINCNDENDLLSTQQLATLLGCSVQWVAIGRYKCYGPPFIKLSPRQVRYRRNAVLAWLQERTYRSTAEDPNPARTGLSPGRPRRSLSESA